ncbi:MAM33 domain-containing protein [Cephalotus follicularis]|uniref:MAM33 domain-containing protein n=1 Tax=Cephalotus follicularis TaxID=3775 RepID=A0A1Q3BWK1_CEPFO|nr:MAM33 domain-containing protein [Cephalotus follicularis]
MARLIIRAWKRTLASPSKALIPQFEQAPNKSISLSSSSSLSLDLNPNSDNVKGQRNYMSETRESAFEANILRLLRNEIQYELQRSSPNQPVTNYRSFTIDDKPGEQWVRMERKYGGNEDIKVEATMFDGSIPGPKSAGGVPGEDVILHITFIVTIAKGDGDIFEIMCSAWPDTMEIKKLFIHQQDKTSAQPYIGPEFKELDDELQDSLYDFLEERGINNDLAVFLHAYMKNKDKTELVRWMRTVKSFFEK